jgi:hypothetical protein
MFSLFSTFIFLVIFGMMGSWVNSLVVTMNGTAQGAHLRKTLRFLIYTDR